MAAVVSLVLSFVVWIASPTLLNLLGATPATYEYAFQYTMWAVVAAELPSVLNTTLCNLVRSQGNPNQASFGIILGCVLNVGLDPLFILGLNMGVVGAAIATCISQYLGLAYLLWHVIRTRKTSLAPVPLRFAPIPRSSIFEILKIGTPAMLQVLLSSVSNAVILSLVAGYDPSAAVAGLGIAQRIEMIPFALAMGISSGVLPLIGFNYAAKNFTRMKNAIRISLLIGLALALIAFVLLEAYAPQSVQFFLNDEQSIGYGAAFVRLRIIALPFITMEFMLMAVFQAIGSARQAFVLSIFRKGTVDIPFMFAMNIVWPLYGLMIVQPTMEFLGCMIALVMYWHMTRKLRNENAESSKGAKEAPLQLAESN